MSTLNYYRRYQQDGSCMVICTRCFLTVGIAQGHAAVKDLESGHVCSRAAQQASSPLQAAALPPLVRASGKLRQRARSVANWNPLVLALALALALYALPTLLECLAAQHGNPWLTVILPGDAFGCAALIALFNLRRTGLILYLALTVVEGALYLTHSLRPVTLAWIVDLVPTLVALTFIASRRLLNGSPRAATP